MALTAPADPQKGQSMLEWAKTIARYLRALHPRDSPDIWPHIGTAGTSYLFKKKPHPEPVVSKHPFQATISHVIFGDDEDWESIKVWINYGSVVESENSATTESITTFGDLLELHADELVWLATYFDLDGTISAIDIVNGVPHDAGWTTYPALYDDYGDDGNAWFHPICAVRNKKAFEEGPDFSDDKKLDQLTNTHLVTQRQCIGGVLLWKLVPGPGGVPG